MNVDKRNRVDDGMLGECAETEIAERNPAMCYRKDDLQHEALNGIARRLSSKTMRSDFLDKHCVDLYHFSPAAYVVFDLAGVILSANHAFCLLLEKSEEEICQHKISDFLTPKSQDEYHLSLKKCCQKGNLTEKAELVFQLDKRQMPTEVYMNYAEESGAGFIRAMLFDLTQTKSLFTQLKKKKERYRIIAEQAHDILFEYQLAQDLMMFSCRFTELTGRAPIIPHFMECMAYESYVFPADLPMILQWLEKIHTKPEPLNCTIRLRRDEDLYVWYKIVATVLFDGETAVKIVGTITNVDEVIKANDLLKKAAQADLLTQLLNKMTAKTAIEKFLRNEGKDGKHALMIIDIDDFKRINDQLGHLFGDAVLSEFSAKLRRIIQPSDIVGRIGGDEFIVLLTQCESREAVKEIAEKICGVFGDIFAGDSPKCSISGSVGICLYPKHAATYNDLFYKADTALYQAKKTGKNRFIFYQNQEVLQYMDEVNLLNRYDGFGSYQERQYADLMFVTSIVELLFEGKDTGSSLAVILSMLGNYFNVDHVCIVETGDDLAYARLACQWYEDSERNKAAYLEELPNAVLEKYSALFNDEDIFYCYDMDILKENHVEMWNSIAGIGVKTTLQCAFFDNRAFKGFIAMDNFENSRIWKQNDIHIFILIGKIIGAYLLKLRVQEQNNRFAIMDMLTNVWNINKFTAEAGTAIEQKIGKFALLSMDIRNFTYFNDRYGYAQGDQLLIAFSRSLRTDLQSGEMLARISGDRFVVLLRFAVKEELHSRIASMLTRLDSLTKGAEEFYKMVVICGVCVVKESYTHVSSIIDRANIARKSAKKSHKSIIAYYDELMEERLIKEKRLEDAMEDALKHQEFYVVYQPKFNIKSKQIVGAEALIRWNSPSWGQIYPDSFIPIVERNGFVVELDFFVLAQVCRKIKEWKEKMKKEICVSVNFSRHHVMLKQSIERAKKIVEQHQLSPYMIEIEITESVFASDAEALLDYITRLHEAGFRVALDDFGTGYSSLNLLKDLPLDVLKLDRNFFHSECITPQEKTVVENVVRMARALGMTVVTEGVETIEQAEFLWEIGCEIAQGYLFSKPIAEEAFEALFLQ